MLADTAGREVDGDVLHLRFDDRIEVYQLSRLPASVGRVRHRGRCVRSVEINFPSPSTLPRKRDGRLELVAAGLDAVQLGIAQGFGFVVAISQIGKQVIRDQNGIEVGNCKPLPHRRVRHVARS